MYQVQPDLGYLQGRAGFLYADPNGLKSVPAPSAGAMAQMIIARGEGDQFADILARGDWSDQQRTLLTSINARMDEIQRAGILTTNTAFPVRQNLEAPARLLVPLDTPFRNKVPRIPGSGIAALWKQITSLGGGWGPNYDQPGGGTASQFFFAQDGAPATLNSVYADKTATYKLAGQLDSISGLAMWAGKA